jgi:Flp pilus assembly protein TadG
MILTHQPRTGSVPERLQPRRAVLTRRSTSPSRLGSVAVELAVLMPFLAFIFAAGYARIFSRALKLEAASRNGAIYAGDNAANSSDTTKITSVVLKDLTDVTPTPTVTITSSTGTDGFKYVRVTVTSTFSTVTHMPGIPQTTTLKRSTDVRVSPDSPKAGTY